MPNARSPQQAFADLLRRKSVQRPASSQPQSRGAREVRGVLASPDPMQKAVQERFAARLAAIARERAANEAGKPRARRRRAKPV